MTCPRDERTYTVTVSTGGTTWTTSGVAATSRAAALYAAARRRGTEWTPGKDTP